MGQWDPTETEPPTRKPALNWPSPPYTYGTNGIPAPKGKEFCINLIDEDLILNQINQAKSEGAELIVASMHWGVEYQTTENE